MTCIRKVAILLGYGESQILEVFKYLKTCSLQDYIGYCFNRRPKTSGRNSQKSTNERKDG